MQCWIYGHLYEGPEELILDIYTYKLMTTLPRRAVEQSLSNGDQWNAQLRCFLNHQSEFSHEHNNTRAIYLSKCLFSPRI